MVSLFPLLLSTVLLALSSNALPTPLERRVVGSLSCKVVKSGKLQLYNTKTGAVDGATFANNFRLNDELAGRERPASLEGAGNPRLLSSYSGAKAEQFDFLACTESQRPGFEDFDPKSNGVYYGHLAITSKPSFCATHLGVFSDEAYLASEECYYSDDSGSPFSYFTYDPSKNGRIEFLGYTGPKGGKPPQQMGGQYDFVPGSSSKKPAVFVHDGSPQFSDWELRLQ